MGKTFLQIAIFVGVFFGIWWCLSQIPWMEALHIQRFTREKQEQISELVLKMHKLEKREVKDRDITDKINELKQIICEDNHIDTETIKIHVFEDEAINAFALPGGHIVVNTALISHCDNADMLAGVMAHEIAHVQLEHVSRRLSREIGLSTLLLLTGGSEHLGTLKEILHTLSSRSFDRDMEREADRRGVAYIMKAKGDPRQLAYFLQGLSETNSGMPEVLQWVSTHPEAKERVDYILKEAPDNIAPTNIISKEKWDRLKSLVTDIDQTAS